MGSTNQSNVLTVHVIPQFVTEPTAMMMTKRTKAPKGRNALLVVFLISSTVSLVPLMHLAFWFEQAPRLLLTTAFSPLNTIDVKVDRITKDLESINTSYYVYDDEEFIRNDERESLHAGKGRGLMIQRFGGFAKAELFMIDALRNHSLRTMDQYNTDLYFIPISLATLLTQVKASGLAYDSAFQSLYNKTTFQALRGHRHFLVSQLDPAFSRSHEHIARNVGLVQHHGPLWNVTVAKEVDHEGCAEAVQRGVYAEGFNEQKATEKRRHLSSRTGVASVGYIPTNDIPLIPASMEKFQRSKHLFFYHTRQEPSLHNSTKYRQALVQPDIMRILAAKSSLGFDVPREEWLDEFADSKFCFAIRGDVPGTRAFLRAVRVGCIPVLVSTLFPYWMTSFKSTGLEVGDYSFVIDEAEFLRNPLGVVEHLESLPDSVIESKLRALALAQRLVAPDHPKSLFVPALLNEVQHSRRRIQSAPEWFKVKKTER